MACIFIKLNFMCQNVLRSQRKCTCLSCEWEELLDIFPRNKPMNIPMSCHKQLSRVTPLHPSESCKFPSGFSGSTRTTSFEFIFVYLHFTVSLGQILTFIVLYKKYRDIKVVRVAAFDCLTLFSLFFQQTSNRIYENYRLLSFYWKFNHIALVLKITSFEKKKKNLI